MSLKANLLMPLVYECVYSCGYSCVWSDLSLHFMSCSQFSACLSDRPLLHVLHWQPAHCQTRLCVLFPLSAPSVLSFTFLPATLYMPYTAHAKRTHRTGQHYVSIRNLFHSHLTLSNFNLSISFLTKVSRFKYTHHTTTVILGDI